MIVGSKTYATEVEDVIEHKLYDALFCVLYSISKKFHCTDIVFNDSGKFTQLFEEQYAAQFRDLAIEFFEELGFDVWPDGKDY